MNFDEKVSLYKMGEKKIIDVYSYILNPLQKYNKMYLKKISDVVTLGTFCYRDQSFINRRGVSCFFHGRRGIEPDHHPHTHAYTKQVEKILISLIPLTPPPPRPPYAQTTLTYDNPILLSGPAEY